MMKSSVYNALDKMNELEKRMDRYSDKAYDLYQEGKEKKSDWYERQADDLKKEIDGMVCCLKILGFNPWVECSYDTGHLRKWHIPLDDIERVC